MARNPIPLRWGLAYGKIISTLSKVQIFRFENALNYAGRIRKVKG
jgi:hypothetical protein